MSVTYQKPDINSFKDLATSTTYKANVLIGSIQEIDIQVGRKNIYDYLIKGLFRFARISEPFLL